MQTILAFIASRLTTASSSSMVLLLLLFFSSSKLCDSFSSTKTSTVTKAALARHDGNHHLLITSTAAAYRQNYHVLWTSTNYGNNSKEQSPGNKQRSLVIDDFIATVIKSLHDKSFESFTLKGPPAPRKNRRSNSKNNNSNNASTETEETDATIERKKEVLRGKYKTILGRLVFLQDKKRRKKKDDQELTNELESGRFYLQVTIKYHLATDIAQNWKISDDKNTSDVREVESRLRGIFASVWGHNRTSNSNDGSTVPLSEWGSAMNKNGDIDIRAGALVTSDGVYELQLHGKKACFFLKKNSNEKRKSQLINDPTQLSHDRTKNVPLSTSSEFFQKLGVTNSDGKPMSGMASKLRQCQKFVEVVSKLVDDNYYDDSRSNNRKAKNIRVIDMGCGRGYLTFSLHSYLSDKYNDDSSSCVVETQGIERRPKLVREINGIARDLGEGKFEKLNFIEGTIGSTHDSLFGDAKLHQNVENDDSVDILIALHACDTATDDAIWFAIERGADVIVTAPCCQHELRPQIDRHASNYPNHILTDVLRHATYRERATEQITDSMRAVLLEIAGYDVQVFEFIGGEHTAKNVMITATKKLWSRRTKMEDAWVEERRMKLVELADFYGVKRQRLASLMGESITTSSPSLKVKTARGMPPL